MTAHQVVGWRDHLPVHPAANLLPLIGKDELRELADDIAKNGLIEAVTIYNNSVLDGRNRLDALALIGRGLDDAHFHNLPDDDPDFDPVAYVLSKNVHRRHLTAEQRRELIAKVLKAEPEKSNLQIAKQVKADDKTVAKVRTELEATSEIPKLTKTVGKDGKSRPARKKPVKPRGRTQKTKLGMFLDATSRLCTNCELAKEVLNEVLPGLNLTAQQKADAKQQLMGAIRTLQKCVARMEKAEAAP